MLKNYLKIALRNLLKHKGFSLINIMGLALGIGCFIVIAMYVVDELSYDRFHEKADRIYRINGHVKFGGVEQNMAYSSDPMGPTLKNDYPEVEQFVRFYASEGSKLIKNGQEFIKEERVVYADSTLFDVFTFNVLAGNSETALDEPNTVVINESTAKRYFGSVQNALNNTIEVNGNPAVLYEVTAVVEDLPTNSHFHFDFFLSFDNVNYSFGQYLSHNFHTYIVLKEGTDYKVFNKRFDDIMQRYILPAMKQYVDVDDLSEFEVSGNFLRYFVIPMTDIHLKSEQGGELEPGGNIQYIYIFSAVAIFILIIACINFINLTTARSSVRAKEVGIRKVLGTEKRNLIYQFLTESIIVATMALLFGLLFVWLSLDWFNSLAGKEMVMSTLIEAKYLLFLLVLPILVGSLAGMYPALYLSAFKPIAVLKGKLNTGSSKDRLRSFLVVFQFSTSIALIIGTIIIYSQLNHIQNSDVGFNKDQVLIVDNSGIDQSTRNSLLTEIQQLTDITAASFAGYIPISESSRSDTVFSTEAVMSTTNGFSMQHWPVNYDYIETLNMKMLSGRNFERSRGADSTAIIINETAAKATGFDDPLGKKLYTLDREGNPQSLTIIGVVKDFNYESLRQKVQPLGLYLGNNSWVSMFRFSSNNVSSLVSTIEQKYKNATTGVPFVYRFMDESFDKMYRQERRVGRIALTFAILAILIACLGLFGLATYIAEQKRKEIGIRKVLGASVSRIVTMLSIDFIKLVIIALVIATPLAWWGMSRWLEDFAYRIDIDWKVFLITGIIALLIAVITLSFQAIKAAVANPVKSLRTE